ncbi:hypothetical protein [Aureimonas pseudogalii]|uniref:PemK-like protein n=1 Tax=Aureimonas pseudogalii TaxID=1744844 RepID=A0A7W6MLU5_9HYPH|nr:hypothetical protein [Aureimonas pseudogalii]MBB4000135.1 hypothetical protein [Aureimonas pseudogalii]
MTDVPKSGSIIPYSYLFGWQRDRGETEGRKSERPVCLLLAIPGRNVTNLVLLAISGEPPRSDQTALEIPLLEIRRAGLREWKQAWILVSEYNYDIAERSYYYNPNVEVRGSFSKGFLAKIAAAMKPLMASGSAKIERFD